jgi:hypothetical protein
MVALLAALALAPWSHPLAFRPLPGWQTGMSGTHSAYVHGVVESSAWIARNARYRDAATADPPSKTLARLPRSGVIVWAGISNSSENGASPIQLDVSKAKHFPCCDGASFASGEYELAGSGPARSYYVIVRIYFGSRPTTALRAEAQRALNQLKLPSSR